VGTGQNFGALSGEPGSPTYNPNAALPPADGEEPYIFFSEHFLGRVVPRAASLIATSLVGCFGHVSGKGRACEGNSYGHGERRNKSFPGTLPLRV